MSRKRAKLPKTWVGVGRFRTPFEISVNQVIGKMIRKGISPTKDQICEALGLDYYAAIDRNKVSSAIYKHKFLFDYAWRVLYEPSPAYQRNYARYMRDTAGYDKWKASDPERYQYLLDYNITDDDIRRYWVMANMWDDFVQAANRWNLFLFTAEGLRYIQPNYWEYTTKQIASAQRLGKGMITILSRHKDLGMMLTSGESIDVAMLTANDTLKMITDGRPYRHRCEECASKGITSEFDSQQKLFQHWQSAHSPQR